MKINCAHTELVDIETLIQNPRNPNKHPEKQLKYLAKIMKHQGWRSPIVVSKRSGFIVNSGQFVKIYSSSGPTNTD